MKLDTLFPHTYLIDMKLNVIKCNLSVVTVFCCCFFFNLGSTNSKFGMLLKPEEKYLRPIEF